MKNIITHFPFWVYKATTCLNFFMADYTSCPRNRAKNVSSRIFFKREMIMYVNEFGTVYVVAHAGSELQVARVPRYGSTKRLENTVQYLLETPSISLIVSEMEGSRTFSAEPFSLSLSLCVCVCVYVCVHHYF
jgi:hypothetical protein